MAEAAYREDGRREELIEGVKMMSPAPNLNHNVVVKNLVLIFGNFLHGKRCQVFGDHVDVFLDDENTFQPDITITCDPDKIQWDGIHGAPDFVCEVLSFATRRNDLGKKKAVYERAGVKEYWIIDPVAKSVDVYLNHEGHFELDNSYIVKVKNRDDKDAPEQLHLKLSLYDDLVINLHDIFANMLER